ncbi:dihydroorotate dehydrogenase electron transfer subunit [Phosphitispora sp. TUW77]|uniref:dihydroorotate dehydrogenase electron transfer subunit n=1 Tax=Phosphitispora sp. TUW77 TaxID=3152361 RepID=UPI003AB33DEF
MSFCGLGEVIVNMRVGPEHFLMRVYVPQLTRLAKPGQFVHVRCSRSLDPLLRRPISLHGIDYNKGTISLLYQVAGTGTRLLAEMNPGDEIDVMGPLGKGFTVPDGIKKALVVGGGIGAAPLFPLIQSLKHYGIQQIVLLGARSADFIIGKEQLESLGVPVKIATDDGSLGYKGFITRLAEDVIAAYKPDYFFACGPNPMLRTLLDITAKYALKGQVSLEEYMGCGVGACLACVCKSKAVAGSGTADSTEGFEYKKVCTDGPVFNASEVILDD